MYIQRLPTGLQNQYFSYCYNPRGDESLNLHYANNDGYKFRHSLERSEKNNQVEVYINYPGADSDQLMNI